MTRIIPALLGLILTLPAAAASERCLISFDGAGFDACSGQTLGPVLASGLLTALEAPPADSPYQVIKFDRPISAAMRRQVEGSGAEILAYLPFHSYLVKADADSRQALGAISGALWTGPYQPAWKIDPNLMTLDQRSERPAALPLHIALHQGVSAAAMLAQLERLAGVEHSFVDAATSREAVVLTVRGQAIDALLPVLAGFDQVAHVGLRKIMNFSNSQGSWLHQSGQSNLRPVFDRGLFGCGQLVGVADSGVDFPHCAFTDPVLAQPPISTCTDGAGCPAATPDFNHRKIPIYYKWSPANDPLGDSACPNGASAGHGTHVAGSILGNNLADPVDCASLTTPGGGSDLDGMAPGARLVAQELGDSLQYLNSLGGNIPHLVSVAYANGARIHNNSWGGGCCFLGLFCLPGCTVSYDAFSQDADRAAWDFPDMAIFFAAGNDGTCCSAPRSVGSPGNAKNVISVGATQRGGSGGNIASFSSRGPVHDQRTKPDIVAQGQGVVSVGSNGDAGTGSCGSCPLSGTSMASPTAAGMAALVREYLERGFYPSGMPVQADGRDFISGALIKAILINGGDSISGTGSGGAAPSQSQGWGRVNLDNVLYFDGDGDDRRLWLIDQADGLITDELHSYTLTVSDDAPLRISLSWSDYPAAIGASVAMVNQLRLEVVDPSGAVWTQKLPTTGTPTPFFDSSDTGFDNRNNVHQIRFNAPEAGDYEIRVRAIQVAMGGSQPYALVANGAIAGDPGEPDFELAISPAAVSVCPEDPATVDVLATSLAGFDAAVNLAVVDGLPVGTSWDFDVNPIVPTSPAAISTLSIDPSDLPRPGSWTVSIAGEAAAMTRTASFELLLPPAPPVPSELLAPANGSTEIERDPVFSWADDSWALSYRFQLAADPDFDQLLIDTLVDSSSYQAETLLPSGTTLFWRVAAQGACGGDDFSAAFSFTTADFPSAGVSPSALDAVLAIDALGEANLLLSNTGTATLVWALVDGEPSLAASAEGSLSCSDHQALGWLSVAPEAGEVAAGESTIITVGFDSAGLQDGETVTGLICLASNDPHLSQLNVPVTLLVIRDPLFEDRFEIPAD